MFDLRIGGVWHADGRAWRVTGLVENPRNLQDEFALVAPGQVAGARAPGDRAVRRQPGQRRRAEPPGGAIAADQRCGPRAASARPRSCWSWPRFGLIFIGLVAVAGFTVMAQRRLRALGMLGAVGATDRHIRLVMVASGAVRGRIRIAGRRGARPRRLARVRAAPGGGRRPRHRPAQPAVAGARRGDGAGSGHRRGRRLPARPVGGPDAGGRGPVRAPGPAARARRRIAGPGLALLAAGLGRLAFTGGWDASLHHGTGALLLFAGIVATSAAAWYSPRWASRCPRPLARRAPVAVRLALRDLGRYRAGPGPPWPRPPSPCSLPSSPASWPPPALATR